MRIAVVTTSYPADEGDPSGHFVRTEVRELELSGHDVRVIAPGPGGAFGWPGVMARVRERPWRSLDAVRWLMAAQRKLGQIEAERVIAHWAVPCAWPVATVAKVAFGESVELEVVSHGGDVRLLTALPRWLRGPLVEAIAARARRWRFVSEPLKQELLLGLPLPLRQRVEELAVVRPPPVEMPVVGSAVARKRRELGSVRVAVSVGRLVRAKRVDRAIEHVAETRRVDALVVIGDGPERARLEELAQSRRVDARFVGKIPRPEALAWMGAASYLVFASEEEGCSTVLREAQEMGIPVERV